jgi:hypothetical protein
MDPVHNVHTVHIVLNVHPVQHVHNVQRPFPCVKSPRARTSRIPSTVTVL